MIDYRVLHDRLTVINCGYIFIFYFNYCVEVISNLLFVNLFLLAVAARDHFFPFVYLFVNSFQNKLYLGYKSVSVIVQITTPEPASVT